MSQHPSSGSVSAEELLRIAEKAIAKAKASMEAVSKPELYHIAGRTFATDAEAKQFANAVAAEADNENVRAAVVSGGDRHTAGLIIVTR